MSRPGCCLSSVSDNTVHAVVIGAGPYGLSLAAHLRANGVAFRIFGKPMQSWQTQMPAGMKLKSDGFASNLFTGATPWTLEEFCREFNRPYHATHLPIAVEDFADYGVEFARRFVPTLEQVNVVNVSREDGVFAITLENGERFAAHNVIVATGVSLFQYTPEEYAYLPQDMITHTADHRDFERFAGREVVVLGHGASSLNSVALMREAGGLPTLLSRHPRIKVMTYDGASRSLWQRVRHPSSELGTSLRSWLTVHFPGVFRALPAWLRRGLTYKHLTPSGGVDLTGRLDGVPMLAGWHVVRAELIPSETLADRRIRLMLRDASGVTRELITSHIVAGTGFRADPVRMAFLSEPLRRAIRLQRGGPVMRRSFECSVRNLYLIGPIGAASFGPLLKFTAGAAYTAERVTRSLRKKMFSAVVVEPAFAKTPITTKP